MRVVGREGGQRRWQALARTVTFSRDRRVVDVEGISKATLFPGPARPQVSLSAGHAVYEAGFGTMGTLRLDTNVRAAVLTAQRPVLRTQALLWNALTGTLTSPGPAQVSVPRLTLSAGRATYETSYETRLPDAATGTLHLTGTVHALVQTAHGQAALTCPGLTWSGRTNIAQSQGPVRAQIPGGLGTTTAADVSVDTRTGNLTGHGFRGTLRLSGE